jgi:hypothetical protein
MWNMLQELGIGFLVVIILTAAVITWFEFNRKR